ncbi:unnamed protein product [Echinostoma caproni]|uniref:CPSF_A domain-containing protein n=1 Tax=Echinostoma caproni TaxID=27848 RepID=A0A182ZZP5_9TREM|nr:unnamed protein product [Echinostoma caproni]
MKALLPSEVFYFASQAQSNIYNLTYVKSEHKEDESQSSSGSSQFNILVAYYRPAADPFANKQCCLLHRFSSDGSTIKTVTKNMDFVYLPGASDIVCIDALFDQVNNEYIVGIGFVKGSTQRIDRMHRSEYLPNCRIRDLSPR